jgi:ATP-dependent helicase Lhr and Lhr-like helicase
MTTTKKVDKTNPLASFHPLVSQWFAAQFAAPTDVQRRAWPVIAAGQHALITAPTGSGKTLTAFLWALNQLIIGAWEPGGTRVIYLSPMKALNTDVRRNLIAPLNALRETFADAGVPFPEITIRTRSSDTDAAERRAMLRRPPEILITTPESLNILLSSESGRVFFPGVRSIILDEIHAIAGTKRGVHCITAVDRIVQRSGEFQRIALTATLRPRYELSASPKNLRLLRPLG